MNTIDTTVQLVSTDKPDGNGRPDPSWVRGTCPDCGEQTVGNLYYVGGKGYICRIECWASLSETPTCDYRKVM